MAYTERYVTTGGSALNGGTSESDAWNIQKGLASITGGTRINIKAGTYTAVTQNGGIVAPTSGNPGAVRGYSVTGVLWPNIDDGYLGRDASGNIITTNMPLIIYTSGELTEWQSIPYVQVSNLQIYTSYNTTTTSFPILTSNANLFHNCILKNMAVGTGVKCTSITTNSALTNCDISMPNAGSGAVVCNIIAGRLQGSRVTSCYGSGVGVVITNSTTNGALIADSIIYNHLYGISGANTANGSQTNIINNTFYLCSGDAIRIPSTALTGCYFISNNHATDNSRFINNPGASVVAITVVGNRTRDNRLADNNLGNYRSFNAATGDNGDATSDFTGSSNNILFLKDNAVGRRASFIKNRDIGATQGFDTYGFAGGA